MVKHSSSNYIQTLLLYGPRGSGKTTIAAHLATLGKFSFVKILTASAVVGRSPLQKVDSIRSAFSEAFTSDLSMIVLDDLHRLVEYMKVGSQITVSHELLHTVTTLLTGTLPAGVKLLVVGTLTVDDGVSMEGAEFLGLPDLFSQHYHVPLLDHASSLTFLNARNIHKLGGGQFTLPSSLQISVRQLLHAIECACIQGSCSPHRNQPSVVRQDHLLDCIMAYITRQMAELDGLLG
jgi:vesicle-fusing ATPase